LPFSTSDFYVIVSYKLNASITNTQQSAITLVESETEWSAVIKWRSRL